MVTSAVPATIRYSCSTSSATWRGVPCAPVMFTVPTDGGMFGQPVVMRYKERRCGCIFVAMPPSPHRRHPNISKPRDFLRHPPQSERILQRNIALFLRDLSVDPPDHERRFHARSAIRPDRGTRSAVSWPKWSGTPASTVPRARFPVTNLSRPTKRVVAFYNHRGTAEQHQGRQERHQLDPSDVASSQQCRSAPASRPGLQSGQTS